MRPFMLICAVASLALGTAPVAANTQTHDFGPHTKDQLSAICARAGGRFLTGPGKWGCRTVRWEISCVSYGKTCSIELLGLLPTGGVSASHTLVTLTATAPPQQGTGLSGNGGAGAIGGPIGGGTKGHIGKP